jgi:hypothetical protein
VWRKSWKRKPVSFVRRTGRTEDAVAEVVVVQDLAARRWEDEGKIVRLARKQLTAEDMNGGAREVDAPAPARNQTD